MKKIEQFHKRRPSEIFTKIDEILAYQICLKYCRWLLFLPRMIFPDLLGTTLRIISQNQDMTKIEQFHRRGPSEMFTKIDEILAYHICLKYFRWLFLPWMIIPDLLIGTSLRIIRRTQDNKNWTISQVRTLGNFDKNGWNFTFSNLSKIFQVTTLSTSNDHPWPIGHHPKDY